MPGHIALLGDSIFDNALYVPGEKSVIANLQSILSDGWQTHLIALDGATVASVFSQLERLPPETTHIVLSVGGNNALGFTSRVMGEPSSSVRQALQMVGESTDEFRQLYRQLIQKINDLPYPLMICTIYDGVPVLSLAERTGLCIFNDFITRTTFEFGATLIDLRLVCNEPSDYASISPIEPSAQGGYKIAQAIAKAIRFSAHFEPCADHSQLTKCTRRLVI